MAVLLSCLSAIFFGSAIATSKRGLRWLDARSGAAISIPTSTLLLLAACPFALDPSQVSLEAVTVFALAGSFFPWCPRRWSFCCAASPASSGPARERRRSSGSP